MIPERLKHLPTWNGAPVPWVAIWTGEMLASPKVRWTPEGIECSGPVVQADGMWWLSVEMHHTGTPLFGQTHSARQRRCMRVPKCQVCGVTDAGPLVFVVPDEKRQRYYWDELGAIINPPTCRPCLEFASTICPHLLSTPPYVEIESPREVRLSHAHGQLVGRNGRPFPDHVLIALDDPDRKFVIGRQLLVSVTP